MLNFRDPNQPTPHPVAIKERNLVLRDGSVVAGIYCCRRSAGLRPGVFATVWTVPGRRPALRHAMTDPLPDTSIQSWIASLNSLPCSNVSDPGCGSLAAF